MTVKYNNICWENVIAGSLIFVNKSFDYQNKNQIYSKPERYWELEDIVVKTQSLVLESLWWGRRKPDPDRWEVGG